MPLSGDKIMPDDSISRRTARHAQKHWTSYSGWAAVAITLMAAFWAWSSERATLKSQVRTIQDTRAVRNTYVDAKLERFDTRLREQAKSLARIEAQSEQAARSRQEMRETLRSIWRAVRTNRDQR